MWYQTTTNLSQVINKNLIFLLIIVIRTYIETFNLLGIEHLAQMKHESVEIFIETVNFSY